MRFFIRHLQKRVGITTVYVTHDQAEAMVISDRIVVMFDGRIHQIGGPRDIYSRPVSREVADFIGLSNFIAAHVASGDGNGGYVLDSPLGQLRCAYAESLDDGQAATIMVRPEAIRLEPANPAASSSNSVPGKVLERFFLGNIQGYKISCENDTVLQVQAEPWTDFAVGDPLWCVFDVEKTWIIRD